MAKKNFKNSARQSVASAFFSEADKQEANEPIDRWDTEDTEATITEKEVIAERTIKPQKSAFDKLMDNAEKLIGKPTELPPYRINLKLKGEYKEYLDQVSWENRTTITGYLNDLIAKDLAEYENKKK